MKRLLLFLLIPAFLAPVLSAQDTEDNAAGVIENARNRLYKSLTARVGDCGMGVETFLDKWEADSPNDVNMMVGRFNFYAAKCTRDTLIRKTSRSYLGQKPALQMKDSSGVTWYYFVDQLFDKAFFAESIEWLDKAIGVEPYRLELHRAKVNQLARFEKEEPSQSLSYVMQLIDRNFKEKPSWKNYEKPAAAGDFDDMIQDFCASFYTMGSVTCREAFRQVSEKMLKYEPNAVFFLDNLGTYNLVVKKNFGKAKKYYSKALKIKPDDQTAKTNMEILAKAEEASKSKKSKK